MGGGKKLGKGEEVAANDEIITRSQTLTHNSICAVCGAIKQFAVEVQTYCAPYIQRPKNP